MDGLRDADSLHTNDTSFVTCGHVVSAELLGLA